MKKARVKWVENLKFIGNAPSGHSIAMDGPKEPGGDDSAIHPGEMTLLALGGCTGIDVVSILKKMRVPFDSFEVTIEADAREEHPKIFTNIRLKYIFKGKKMDESKVKQAISLSQDKYCSVSAMMRKSAEISFDYDILDS